MEYRNATEASRIGAELIGEHHPHLLGVRVDFLFTDKTAKSKGRETWGKAKKVGGLNAFLANSGEQNRYGFSEDFFVIEVSEEIWQRLDTRKRKALIDDQLCRCEIETDEEGHTRLAVVGPDIATFESVLRRHGLWNETIEDFVKTGAEQLSLTGVAG